MRDGARRARAVWFVAPRAVEVRDCELPEPGRGEVLVRTLFSGISPGSEVLAYRGHIDETVSLDETLGSLKGQFTFPFRYGYSCVGQLEHSRSGRSEGEAVFAFHPHQDRFVVPADDAFPTGAVDHRTATLFPLVETALQVSLDAGPVSSTVVVLLGLGVVGILSGLLLQRAGARVVAAEPVEWRRKLAVSLGIRSVPPEELEEVVAKQTGGRGASLLVEASGNPAALAPALRLLAHEGTALVVSWYGNRQVALPLGAEFHRRRLTIRSSQVSTIPAALA